MTRILFAPDSYGGFLSAPEAVALALATCPHWRGHPMADGGEGTLQALLHHRPDGFLVHTGTVSDAWGRPREASWLEDRGTGVLYAEAAEANGLRWLEGPPRGMATTSRGVGELLRDHLLPTGKPIRLGLGGSATVDGGIGAAEVLGVQVDLSRVEIWCDVRTPLAEACAHYGPQKGLSADEIEVQTAWLLRWAERLNRWRRPPPLPLNLVAGGAAGGLGFYLAAMGAPLTPGAEAFARNTSLHDVLRDVDFVVVGEGRLDASSMEGKVAEVVLQHAARAGIPVVALVGQHRLGSFPGPVVEIGLPTVEAFVEGVQRVNLLICGG